MIRIKIKEFLSLNLSMQWLLLRARNPRLTGNLVLKTYKMKTLKVKHFLVGEWRTARQKEKVST
jgi:hypothetical protein